MIRRKKVHRHEKEIKVQIALGVFDVNKICGTDMLAIEDWNTISAIGLLWSEKKESYIGENGWEIFLATWIASNQRPRDERYRDIKYLELIAMGNTALRTKEKGRAQSAERIGKRCHAK